MDRVLYTIPFLRVVYYNPFIDGVDTVKRAVSVLPRERTRTLPCHNVLGTAM